MKMLSRVRMIFFDCVIAFYYCNYGVSNMLKFCSHHFDQVVGDCFMDCVNCLIRFANNKSSHRISLKAIAILRICEDRLCRGLLDYL